MAALVMLNSKTMLEKALDVTLAEEDGKHPLRYHNLLSRNMAWNRRLKLLNLVSVNDA